jgi:Bacteriophage replication protein O
MSTPLSPTFNGFQSPHYTMVPDELFDELLTTLSGAELKVLLYIIRRTFGFKQDADAISLAQMLSGITTKDGRVLDRGIGLSKPTLLAALRSLIAQNIIETQRRRSISHGDEPTVYKLKFAASAPSATPAGTPTTSALPTDETEPQDDDSTPRGKKTLPPPVVKKVNHPVVKKLDHTINSYTKYRISNIRKEKPEQIDDEAVYAETTIVLEEAPPPKPSGDRAGGDTNTTAPHQKTLQRGFTGVGETLERRRRHFREQGSTARDALLPPIEQFAAEFGDRASLKSSTSRACNLLERADVSHEQFVTYLWEARAITRDRIAHPPRGSQPITAKMGYFFSVLTERLGLADDVTPAVDVHCKYTSLAL